MSFQAFKPHTSVILWS